MIQYLKEKEERVVQNFTVNFPFYTVSKTVCNCNLVFLSSARRFYSQSRIITIYMLFIFRIGNCNTVVMGKAKKFFYS